MNWLEFDQLLRTREERIMRTDPIGAAVLELRQEIKEINHSPVIVWFPGCVPCFMLHLWSQLSEIEREWERRKEAVISDYRLVELSTMYGEDLWTEL